MAAVWEWARRSAFSLRRDVAIVRSKQVVTFFNACGRKASTFNLPDAREHSIFIRVVESNANFVWSAEEDD